MLQSTRPTMHLLGMKAVSPAATATRWPKSPSPNPPPLLNLEEASELKSATVTGMAPEFEEASRPPLLGITNPLLSFSENSKRSCGKGFGSSPKRRDQSIAVAGEA